MRHIEALYIEGEFVWPDPVPVQLRCAADGDSPRRSRGVGAVLEALWTAAVQLHLNLFDFHVGFEQVYGAASQLAVELQLRPRDGTTRIDFHFHLAMQNIDLRDQCIDYDPVTRLDIDAGLHGLPLEIELQNVSLGQNRRACEPVSVFQDQASSQLYLPGFEPEIKFTLTIFEILWIFRC